MRTASTILLALLCAPRLLAAEPVHPRLSAALLDAHRLRVQGEGFPPGSRVVLSADSDTPHASVACYSDFTRIALPKEGRFDLVINTDPRSGCDFSCGAEPEAWVVTAEAMDGQPLAQSARVPCQPAPHRAR
jgi:hypothetical protein